eukprot:g15337.t1
MGALRKRMITATPQTSAVLIVTAPRAPSILLSLFGVRELAFASKPAIPFLAKEKANPLQLIVQMKVNPHIFRHCLASHVQPSEVSTMHFQLMPFEASFEVFPVFPTAIAR